MLYRPGIDWYNELKNFGLATISNLGIINCSMYFLYFFEYSCLHIKIVFFSIFSFSKPSFSISKFGPSPRPSVCNSQLFLLRHVRIVLLLNIILHLSSLLTNLQFCLDFYTFIIWLFSSDTLQVLMFFCLTASELDFMDIFFFVNKNCKN